MLHLSIEALAQAVTTSVCTIAEAVQQIEQATTDQHAQAAMLLRLLSLTARDRLAMRQGLASGHVLHTDVAIIGAGLQGMQLAFALAAAGRSFVVLEQWGMWGGGFHGYASAVGQGVLITPIHLGLEQAASDPTPYTLAVGWQDWLQTADPAVRSFFGRVPWPGERPSRAPLVALWQQIEHFVRRYRLDAHGYACAVQDVVLPLRPDAPVRIVTDTDAYVLARRVVLATGRGAVRHAFNHRVPGAGDHTNRVLPLLHRDPWERQQQIQPGERVLIVGAGNSATTWAVALADEGRAEVVLLAARAGFGAATGSSFPTLDPATFRRLPVPQRATLLSDRSGIVVQELCDRLDPHLARGRVRLREHTGEVTDIAAINDQSRLRYRVSFTNAPTVECDRVYIATGFERVCTDTLYAAWPSLYRLVQWGGLPTYNGYAVPDDVFWAGSDRRLVPLCRAAMLWFPPQPMPAAQRSAEIVAALT